MANSSGVLFGADVSRFQPGLNVGQLPLDYVIAKTGQAKSADPGYDYGTTVDSMYTTHKRNALAAGKLFSSYFYLGSGLSPAANAAHHASIEPDRAVPAMLDWEHGSGDVAHLRACYAAFRAAGYYVWGIYAPRWFWQDRGSQSLADMAPLVSSRYPDTKPGSLADEYASTPESYWSAYGGAPVAMLQFTSVGRVAPYSGNLDLDAFKGTRAQLAALWSATAPNPTIPSQPPGDDVSLIESRPLPLSLNTRSEYFRNLGGSAGAKIILRVPNFSWTTRLGEVVWVGDILAFGSNNAGIGHNPQSDPNFPDKVVTDWTFDLPGAITAEFKYSTAFSGGRLEIWA